MADILIVVEGGLVRDVYGVQEESFRVVYPGEGDTDDADNDAHRIVAFLVTEGDSLSSSDLLSLMRTLVSVIGVRKWISVTAKQQDDSEEGAHSG